MLLLICDSQGALTCLVCFMFSYLSSVADFSGFNIFFFFLCVSAKLRQRHNQLKVSIMHLFSNIFYISVTPLCFQEGIAFLSYKMLPLKSLSTSFSCIILFISLTCLKLVGKRLAFKVMGKCDFQALAVHVYGWSSCRERRCCCFSCRFPPATGKERVGPRGTKPQETSGYLLRGCFPPALMECGT